MGLIVIVIHSITNDACSHRSWLIGSEPSLQRRSVSDSSDNVGSVTLAAVHGHIDFSPTLQIIAGCCESYPPRAAGRSFASVLTRVWLSDLRNAISWDLIDCDWLLCVLPVYGMSIFRAERAVYFFVLVGIVSVPFLLIHEKNITMKDSLKKLLR